MLLQQVVNEGLIAVEQVDYSLTGMQRLFNSRAWLGDAVLASLAEILGVDIYLARAYTNDLEAHRYIPSYSPRQGAILIIGNEQHYEVVAQGKPGELRTVFLPETPFYQVLQRKFAISPEDGPLDYRPEATFIRDAANVLVSMPLKYDLKERVREIFPEADDPFRALLERLWNPITVRGQLERRLRALPEGEGDEVILPSQFLLDDVTEYLLKSPQADYPAVVQYLLDRDSFSPETAVLLSTPLPEELV
jgi:hypothetical protein